jgi:hypothetical protein
MVETTHVNFPVSEQPSDIRHMGVFAHGSLFL